MSLALGGTCVKNDGKWEIGPTKLRLTNIGESVFGIDNELVREAASSVWSVPTA